MQQLNDILATIDSYIGGSQWFVYLLLAVGVFFTIYLGFPQIRFFGHALRIVRGKFDKDGDEGDTSHFQALATALSGTVGTGNIAGVAFALHLGGPPALFWMLVTAFLGMTTKFVEVTLSHKYREKTDDGSMAGGPMYYMKNANFTFSGKKVNLKWLAAIFAVATVISSFGTGNLPQINSIASSVYASFGIEKMVTGGVLAVLLGVVIIGGIKRIAKVTEKLVPSMALIYVIGALSVLLYNNENIIPGFISVFSNVFSGSAATGGFLGASIIYAFNRGVNRGLFSNEAGQGSAPIAHASAKAHEPVSEGMVAILEPFIDTIIICTLTGITLISSGVWSEKHLNDFQFAEVEVLQGDYNEDDNERRLYCHINNVKRLEVDGQKLTFDSIPPFRGELQVADGKIITDNITILHARSVAEDLKVLKLEEQDNLLPEEVPYTGAIRVKNGSIVETDGLIFRGMSLIHSAPLTSVAFNQGLFGNFGGYIVTIGLLLFAFSTSISWSYYGDRAITYLIGSKGILPFRILYILGFFLASFTDTQIIWTFSGIAIALMTLPNLIGIFWLRQDMKRTLKEYWEDFDSIFPGGRKNKKITK
ncbi:amino acid carrier protein [bacterium]|nr:amino acid carrier protein [bacterium]